MSRMLPGLLLLAATALAGGPPLRSKKVRAAVESVQPAVVKIFGAKGFRGIYGYMTGVIVHRSGLVITRRSVTIEETDMIRCHRTKILPTTRRASSIPSNTPTMAIAMSSFVSRPVR